MIEEIDEDGYIIPRKKSAVLYEQSKKIICNALSDDHEHVIEWVTTALLSF